MTGTDQKRRFEASRDHLSHRFSLSTLISADENDGVQATQCKM